LESEAHFFENFSDQSCQAWRQVLTAQAAITIMALNTRLGVNFGQTIFTNVDCTNRTNGYAIGAPNTFFFRNSHYPFPFSYVFYLNISLF
jgi:hypothetical protein